MTPPSSTIFEILDATWPAHRLIKQGPFTLRQGKGGGKRVSAASLNDVFNESDIENAEETMGRLSQTPLFSLRPQDRELDRHLEQRGYDVVDPCNIYGISSAMLAEVTLHASVCSKSGSLWKSKRISGRQVAFKKQALGDHDTRY